MTRDQLESQLRKFIDDHSHVIGWGGLAARIKEARVAKAEQALRPLLMDLTASELLAAEEIALLALQPPTPPSAPHVEPAPRSKQRRAARQKG